MCDWQAVPALRPDWVAAMSHARLEGCQVGAGTFPAAASWPCTFQPTANTTSQQRQGTSNLRLHQPLLPESFTGKAPEAGLWVRAEQSNGNDDGFAKPVSP
jgi:hypothetical protein